MQNSYSDVLHDFSTSSFSHTQYLFSITFQSLLFFKILIATTVEVKHQQSCISVFVVMQQFQVLTRSTSPDMTTVSHAWPYDRFIEIQSNLRRKKFHRTNQGSNFLGGNFSNRNNVRAPIQFGREIQTQHFKIFHFWNPAWLHYQTPAWKCLRKRCCKMKRYCNQLFQDKN